MHIQRIVLPVANSYMLSHKNGYVLVDTGKPGDMPRLAHALASAGASFTDVTHIIHTHGHSDHCGSTAEIIAAYPHIQTVIHTGDAHMCTNGVSDPVHNTRLFSRLLRLAINPSFPRFTNNIVIKGQRSGLLRRLGIAADIVHTPGHTPGSISIVADDGQAIIGDVLMGGILGGKLLAQRPTYHYYVTNMDELHASITRLLETNSHTFYVGHGGPLSRHSVAAWFGGR